MLRSLPVRGFCQFTLMVDTPLCPKRALPKESAINLMLNRKPEHIDWGLEGGFSSNLQRDFCTSLGSYAANDVIRVI